MWNPKTINTDHPLYLAIADALERDINSGALKPGQQLPPHRELADVIGVNVSTITRAYKEAERRGLISGTVGRGTFVSSDVATVTSIVRTDISESGLLELGSLLPLYSVEPDITEEIIRLSGSKKINEYLRYTDPQGLPEHRDTGASWVRRYGINTSADNIVVCAGSQHALNCCLLSLFQSGDRIAVENLTYPSMKTLSSMLGIRLVPILMDKEGMLPEALDMACRRDSIRGLYLMPGFQNPTTASMSSGRRNAIAEVALRHNLTLIEDDAYAVTIPDQPSAITSLMPDNSVYIAGVSKAFYAGLRTSYVAAPKHLRSRIVNAVLNTIWMTPPLNAALTSEFIKDGTAEKIISLKLKEAAKRFSVAEKALSCLTFAGTPKGFFIWLNLPAPWTGKEFELCARENGVKLFCAEKFAVGSFSVPPAVRISLTGAASIDELSKGFEIITNILSAGFCELNWPIL